MFFHSDFFDCTIVSIAIAVTQGGLKRNVPHKMSGHKLYA